jgi:hypothetical protein
MKANSKASTTSKHAAVVKRGASTTSAGELAAIARTVSRYKSDQRALQKAMRKAGIITETGKLTKEYRSE